MRKLAQAKEVPFDILRGLGQGAMVPVGQTPTISGSTTTNSQNNPAPYRSGLGSAGQNNPAPYRSGLGSDGQNNPTPYRSGLGSAGQVPPSPSTVVRGNEAKAATP